jgi:hypothetical protein
MFLEILDDLELAKEIWAYTAATYRSHIEDLGTVYGIPRGPSVILNGIAITPSQECPIFRGDTQGSCHHDDARLLGMLRPELADQSRHMSDKSLPIEIPSVSSKSPSTRSSNPLDVAVKAVANLGRTSSLNRACE